MIRDFFETGKIRSAYIPGKVTVQKVYIFI